MKCISHELRTPVNGNINYIETALKDERISLEIKDIYLSPCLYCL